MLKGDSGFVEAVATVIIVLTVFVIFAYVLYDSSTTNVFLKEKRENIDEVDIAHLARSCLEDNGILPVEKLEENKNKQMSEFCKVNTDASVSVRDTETGNTWLFGGGDVNKGHNIFVIIAYENELHIGEIIADA